MTIVERAIEIATEKHAGQTRRDGKPYVTHPIAVMEIVTKSWISPWPAWYVEISQVAALFHDIPEDTDTTAIELVRQLEDEGYFEVGSVHSSALLKALILLNKNNHASYLEYIVAVKEDLIARRVKMADVTHNLIDQKDKKLKDKYELAYYILVMSKA